MRDDAATDDVGAEIRSTAKIVGLRNIDVPSLESVERRRLQLWLVMAVVLWGLSLPLAPYLSPSAPLLVQLVALGAVCVFGAGLYFILVHVSGAQRLDLLLRRLRR